ncbi:GNAT family N-acetyltransferase [Qipengyuania sp. JC766]|uniref:GNAT family N-acetyltransferase n=1 Tax=Qipengyuania sp. JC766 TaxID=3232139 RepID=UPI00345B2317
MSDVSYHERVNALQALASTGPAPFDRPEWYALLADRRAEPLFVTNGQSALALAREDGALVSLANWYSFTWRPLNPQQQSLDTIAGALRKRAHRVSLAPVPDEDGSASALEAAFRKAGWQVTREACDHNHILPVNGRSFSEYWAQRPGRMRTTFKRKAKKVETQIVTRFEEDVWQSYEEIYRSSWKPEEGDTALLRSFAEQEGVAGRLRLGLARHDGQPVAAQFWTVENGVAYIHKLAHLEELKALSAGTTLSAALFEHVIDTDRVDLVDFGTGNDAYKRDWMELDRPRYRIDCLDPRQPRAWPALAKRALRRLAPRRSAS